MSKKLVWQVRGTMSTIDIRKTSITDLDTDAVVNAANDGLWAGGGVCGAIFAAAGHDKMEAACQKIGHCDTGSAVITPGFDLKAKYIIHAVGPRFIDGLHKEPELLYSAYRKSLELAVENGCKSVGFPLISAGIFGYPVRNAWKVALDACMTFLDEHADAPLDIVFAVLAQDILETGENVFGELVASRVSVAQKKDWKTSDMPAKHETFVLRRAFTPKEMAALRHGHIPQEMEDKWFWYMDGDTLFAHRSWSGICIYKIEFKPDGNHTVTANRDPEQYKCTSVEEDIETLNRLFDWWTQENYDYCGEWIAETGEMLEKAGKAKKSDD